MNIEPVEYALKNQLAMIDWCVIVLFIVISIGIGVYFSRRGTKNIREYFASGQGSSWWLLGTSMVATTFAADTPLAISGLVIKQGIWGNWFWWSQIPMFVLGVYFFSRLWRRAQILTDTELVELRYSGRPAKILRCFRAIYFALPYNCLIMGWVNLSMTKIMGLTFQLPKIWAVMICILITGAYCSVSGLWGVMATDFFQFFFAMGMAIVLAVVSVQAVGGMTAILNKLPELYGPDRASSMISIIPSIQAPNHGFTIFLVYLLLLWWTVGNTDGGAYFAQRMIAAKNEKHSFLGYLWFNIAHFCLRPWPWIVVGMVAAVYFPGIASKNPLTGKLEPDPELGYIASMLTFLKPGLLGMMLASFLAAFMSTISTQINWGASYLINDFYRPFINKNASERHYVVVSIATTILMAVLGGVISFFMNDIFVGWLLFSAINAGIGIVYIARWYWWRINAWSEISAISSIIASVALILFIRSEIILKASLITIPLVCLGALFSLGLCCKQWRRQYIKSSFFIIFLAIVAIVVVLIITLPEKKFPWTLIYTVPISSVVWLTVTMLTAPVDESKLIAFYSRVQPGGPGWKRIAEKLPSSTIITGSLFTRKNMFGALFAIAAVLSALLSVGNFLVGNKWVGMLLIGVLCFSIMMVLRYLSSQQWQA
ncbi:MAG: Na+:solute symporter [candidate division KSB1 bacterium]|nr:Na+:solute symporter [candidate division KSB1 bacterium]